MIKCGILILWKNNHGPLDIIYTRSNHLIRYSSLNIQTPSFYFGNNFSEFFTDNLCEKLRAAISHSGIAMVRSCIILCRFQLPEYNLGPNL